MLLDSNYREIALSCPRSISSHPIVLYVSRVCKYKIRKFRKRFCHYSRNKFKDVQILEKKFSRSEFLELSVSAHQFIEKSANILTGRWNIVNK